MYIMDIEYISMFALLHIVTIVISLFLFFFTAQARMIYFFINQLLLVCDKKIRCSVKREEGLKWTIKFPNALF